MFITFEGIDGSGKTTISRRIVDRLNKDPKLGFNFYWTRLPGETELGRRIRDIVLAENELGNALDISPWAELLLYLADRAQCVDKHILPLLAPPSNIVICDRFDDSTRAYQGGGRQLGLRTIDKILRVAVPALTPYLTLYLDVPIEVGLARVAKSNKRKDRMESLGIDFYKRTVDAYEKIITGFPFRRIVRIDANREIGAVEEFALEIILNEVREKKQ